MENNKKRIKDKRAERLEKELESRKGSKDGWGTAEEIKSGETKSFKAREDELLSKINNSSEGRFTFEDFLIGQKEEEKKDESKNKTKGGRKTENKDEKKITLNELIREFHADIPRYKYMLYFLRAYYRVDADDAEMETLFLDIESGAIKAKSKEAAESGKILSHLIECVQKDFCDSGLPDRFCRKSYIKKMILGFNESFLLDAMALGLPMSLEQVEIFLTKVIQRSGLDYYKPKEFLLYLTLGGFSDGKNAYRVFCQLEKQYDSLKAVPVIEWQGDTKSIMFKGEEILRKIKDDQKSQEDYREQDIVSPKLQELLTWHKSLQKPAERSAKKVFQKLLFEVRRLYASEVDEYQSIRQELEDSRLLALRKRGAGCLQIEYLPDTEIVLKKGTRFYRNREDPQLFNGRVYFELEQKTVLPARNTAVLTVHVHTMTKRPESVSRNTTVHLENGLSLAMKGNPEICKQIYRVRTYKAVKRYQSDKDNGIIEIECALGCRIPKNTEFEYKDGKETYHFKTVQDCQAPEYAAEEIEVVCTDLTVGVQTKAGLAYEELAPSGSIRYMETPAKGIVRVNNPRPVNYQEAQESYSGFLSDATPALEIRAVKKERVQASMEETPGFVSKEEKNQIWTMEKYLRGVAVRHNAPGSYSYTISAAEDITYRKPVGEMDYAQGKITVLCKYGMSFPKGTVFLYQDKKRKQTYRYQTTKNYLHVPISTFLQYLYQSLDYKEGIEELDINPDYFTDWFRETKIDDSVIRKFDSKTDSQKRAYLLTLIFLKFAKELKRKEIYSGNFSKLKMRQILSQFEETVDDIMDQCRLSKLYLRNPYDCLLVYLLTNTEPVEILRAIWVVISGRKE